MGVGKSAGLILIFIILSIVAVMFISNISEMRNDYSENTSYYETGERVSGLFDLIRILITPLVIVLIFIVFILIIKWALSKGGSY